MMKEFYGQMERHEIQQEVDRLQRELQLKKDQGMFSEIAILEQKLNLAKSYLIDPGTVKAGSIVSVKGYDEPFHISYTKGVFAWGNFEGETEARAIPFSLLILPKH
jgi:hypothetical protein